MQRSARIAALIAIAVIGTAAIGSELVYLHWFRSVVAQGYRSHLETTPEALENEIRAALPPGTPQAAVEAALQARRIDFSYDATSRQIRAAARYLKGSNPIVETGMSIEFEFDANAALTTMTAQAKFTGP